MVSSFLQQILLQLLFLGITGGAVLPQDQAEPVLQDPSVNAGKPFSAARSVAAATLAMAGRVCCVVVQIKSAAL